MRVFLTGATGALGRRLVPQLIDRGHTVVGTVHSPHKAGLLRAQGGQPVVLDLLDAGAVLNVVRAIQPDAIVHQATALANVHDLRNADRAFAATNELRTRGTDALLVAAEEVGVPRFVAQSYAGWPYARQGGPIKTEDDPLDPRPPAKIRKTLAAIRHLEHAVVEAGGLALRYGSFYGSLGDGLLAAVRRRQLPLIGRAGGFWSFVHLDDAATATVLALERGDPGVYNIVDDHPAPVRSWLPDPGGGRRRQAAPSRSALAGPAAGG